MMIVFIDTYLTFIAMISRLLFNNLARPAITNKGRSQQPRFIWILLHFSSKLCISV